MVDKISVYRIRRRKGLARIHFLKELGAPKEVIDNERKLFVVLRMMVKSTHWYQNKIIN